MDLLFTNFPYFMSVYFAVSIETGVTAFCVCLAILMLVYRRQKPLYWTILCAGYFAALLIVTLLNTNRAAAGSGVILNPFHGLIQVLTTGNVHFFRGMVSNCLLFVPFGMMLDPYFGLKSKPLQGALILGVSLTIELLQHYCHRGFFETEDILCNVLGGLLGIALLHVVRSRIRPTHTEP